MVYILDLMTITFLVQTREMGQIYPKTVLLLKLIHKQQN